MSASDNGEPDQNGQNGVNGFYSQHVSNENRYPTAPTGPGGSAGSLPRHPQVSFPSELEDPYDPNSDPQPQSALKIPGGGPAGARNSSRRNASSSPFIPKKRKPRP